MTSFRFGTVGSPISTPKKPGGSIGAIQTLAEMQLFAFELGWVQSVRVSEETCQLIKSNSKQYDVSLSVHAPYFINLNGSNEEWPKSRKRLMDAAYYGHLAGATDIIFHPGSYFEQAPEDVLKIAIPRLSECVTELRSANNPVCLRPETMGKSAMLGSFEDTLKMSQEIPGVLPCLDFAHLHARPGDGSMNSIEEWTSLLSTYEKTLGSESLHKMHIHLSGIEYSAKGERNHLPIRESDLNIQGLLQTLINYDCSGRILCESPIMEEDALFMQSYWNSLT
ncbi:MAG: TIM barrel protein [Anaerolineaceae bacterium]